MAKPISKKSYVKASAAKPYIKPPPGDKTCGLEPAIHFYEIEDGDETEKGEDTETLFVYDLSLAASKQNLAKRHFPYIGKLDHEGPMVINTMRDLTVRMFENLDINSPTNVDKRLAYTQRILRGSTLKKISRGSGNVQAVGKGSRG